LVASNTGTEQQNTLSLSDATVLNQALAGVSISNATQSNLVDANAAIAAASSVATISAAQSQFIDKTAPSAPLGLDVDALTNDMTPMVRVLLNITSSDGEAVVMGDSLVLFDGLVEVGRQVLTAAHIASGRADIQTAPLAEGLHSLTALVVDQAGNIGVKGELQPVQIDRSGPQATLMSSTDNLAAGARSELTLIFNETVTGLSLEDFVVTGGGQLTALSGPLVRDGQQVYTLSYMAPTQGAAGTVKLLASTYSDLAGNEGALSNTLDLATVNPPVLTITAAGGADLVISSQAGDAMIQGNAQGINGPVAIFLVRTCWVLRRFQVAPGLTRSPMRICRF
jgi:hypothetical protein